jgi:aryl-alcohol dehydrogenase-like predicted oxidoreductase
MPFILGTANLFSNYGIEKITKNVEELETLNIFKNAYSLGISRIDTAVSYQNVENFLGSNINEIVSFKIDSKISLGRQFDENEMMENVFSLLERLKIKKLNTLYLHNLNPLSDSNIKITAKCMNKILEEGLAESIGVSVYTDQEIKFCLEKYPNFKSFQILENICDRRFIHSKYLASLSESGIELNIRSIFLQGLLLSELKSIPAYLESATQSLTEFQDLAASINSNRFKLCVAYAKQIPWASNVVVGVGSLAELTAITSVKETLPKNFLEKVPELPENLKDPRNWKK